MRYIQVIVIITCFISSCTKKGSQIPKFESLNFPKVESINARYLFSKEEHARPLSIGGTAYFQYRNGNILMKRIGGNLPVPGAGQFYTTDVYDTIQYKASNEILASTKNRISGFSLFSQNREFAIENGLIMRKITYDETGSDTIYYSYDKNKTLKRTEQYFKYQMVTKDYFFDSNNNLQEISTVKRFRIDSSVIYKAEESFGGYDNKTNPLKGQTLWDDILYRSLSKNNFTTYSYINGTATERKYWKLIYDSSGNVDYSE